MYDELIKTLRIRAALWEKMYDEDDVLKQAADVIEDLENKLNLWRQDKISRWIPMTERMPESGVCVLVTDGLEVGEGWLTEITNTQGHFMRWCVPMTDIDVDRRPITHWMPMPKAPRDGE